jgi:hypothetical protein
MNALTRLERISRHCSFGTGGDIREELLHLEQTESTMTPTP